MLKEHLDGSENATTGDVSMVAGGHTSTTICAGCCQCIEERYYLKAVERHWHLSCLQCYECKLPLHTRFSCYSRQGNIYCKEDYYRYVTWKSTYTGTRIYINFIHILYRPTYAIW